MFDVTRISIVENGGRRVSAAVSAIRSQPGWVTRFALMTFLIVISLPILLLVLLAIVASVIVFGILAGVNALVARIRGGLPQRDGRENVRVIRRGDG